MEKKHKFWKGWFTAGVIAIAAGFLITAAPFLASLAGVWVGGELAIGLSAIGTFVAAGLGFISTAFSSLGWIAAAIYDRGQSRRDTRKKSYN